MDISLILGIGSSIYRFPAIKIPSSIIFRIQYKTSFDLYWGMADETNSFGIIGWTYPFSSGYKLSEIAKDRENKKPKWNSFSDMQLIAGVEYLNSKEDNAIFVTDDQDIIRSFKNADKERFVITLKEYLNKLEPYK